MNSVLAEANIEKMADFFMNKLKESDDKEKAIHLVDYSYRWYLGLRGSDIFEEEIDVQDFLNNIWSCYGELSAERLREMLNSECIYIHYNSRYSYAIRNGRPHILSRDASGVWLTHKHNPYMKDFYSYDNEEIEKYLPPNVVITISDNGLYGLYEILRLGRKEMENKKKLGRKEMENKKKLVRKAMINDKKQKLKAIPICEMAAVIREKSKAKGVLVMIDHDGEGTQMGASNIEKEHAIKLLKYWSDVLIRELESEKE